MPGFIKAKKNLTGDLTHLGDAIHCWEEITKDPDHGHYCIFVYNEPKDHLEVYASGCDNKESSSHHTCYEICSELERKGMGCFGGYSYKSVKCEIPGHKDYEYKYACFVCIPRKGQKSQSDSNGNSNTNITNSSTVTCKNEAELLSIKNRVKSQVFKNHVHLWEIHSASKLESPEWWNKIRQEMGNSAVHGEFGGNHYHHNIDCEDTEHKRLLRETTDKHLKAREERRSYHTQLYDEEQQRRISLLDFIDQEAEEERRHSQSWAKELMDEEQDRRIKEGGTNGDSNNNNNNNVKSKSNSMTKNYLSHSERHSLIKNELLHHESLAKLENKQRASTRKEIPQQMNLRQKELQEQWEAPQKRADMIRDKHRDLAIRIINAEQRRRTSMTNLNNLNSNANPNAPTPLEEEVNKAHRCKEISSAIHEELMVAHEIMSKALNQRHSKIAMEKEKNYRESNMDLPPGHIIVQKDNLHDELKMKIIETPALGT